MRDGPSAGVDFLLLLGEVFRSRGGIEAFNRNLLSTLGGAGQHCTALLLNDAAVPVPSSFPSTVELVPCARSQFRVLWKIRFAAAAFSRALRARPRRLICGHINFVSICVWLNRILGLPYIVATHGIEVWNLSNSGKKGLRRAALVIAVSDYTRQRILEQIPELTRVEVLPNAVDMERFLPAPKSTQLARVCGVEGCRVLLTVGRLTVGDRYKGYDVVLRALARVVHQRRDMKYIIVGSGEIAEELRGLARQLGIERHLVLTGGVSDAELVDHYRLCDIFLMPSKGEGFGIVYVEALACGKPVIAGNQDAAREALLDGRLGWLVDPNSADAVADAILEILEAKHPDPRLDPDFLREQVKAHFSLPRFRERVESLLQSVH